MTPYTRVWRYSISHGCNKHTTKSNVSVACAYTMHLATHMYTVVTPACALNMQVPGLISEYQRRGCPLQHYESMQAMLDAENHTTEEGPPPTYTVVTTPTGAQYMTDGNTSTWLGNGQWSNAFQEGDKHFILELNTNELKECGATLAAVQDSI